MAAPTVFRVRQILDSLDSAAKVNLKKLLPPKLKMPDAPTGRYPLALLSSFPKGHGYSCLGLIAESLLGRPPAEITMDTLVTAVTTLAPDTPAVALGKIRASKTTPPFLEAIVATRQALDAVVRPADGPLRHEEVVQHGVVQGHPDFRNNTQVIEVKLTGLLKENWTYFLFQVFAYGALAPEVTDLYLALPLQKTVWHADIRAWPTRQQYRDTLVAHATRMGTTGLENALARMLLCGLHGIGHHAQKHKSLLTTVQALGDFSRPYQIFLGNPQGSKIAVSDADLAATAAFVASSKARVFVHSPYIINLSSTTTDWTVPLLQKLLQVSAAAGFQGVVVHVGKACKMETAAAVEAMRAAITASAAVATAECPLLLETPAGQGTETLTDRAEFLDFVASFETPKVRACVDTCHVFACGYNPLEYLTAAIARPGLLKLVHYNDSAGVCGSCVDRHAPAGDGQIGLDTMTQIAGLCTGHGIPMVIE